MAKGIVVTQGERVSQFGLEKLERARLYGSRRRVALGPDGAPCGRGQLTDDGQVLLRAGMTAQGYFTADGRQVESAELIGVDAAGLPLPLVSSTLGVAQALEGPVSARDLLDLSITAVYRLIPESLDDALGAALAAGQVFRVAFNYRPDYRAETAYLVRNDAGLFALVGTPSPAAWLEPQSPPPLVEDDDASDELDFDMF